MRILYVSQYFPPEVGAPAVRVHDLSRMWVEQGHDVTVLTGFPNHPNGVLHPDYRRKIRRLTMRETVDGIKVVRSWLIPLPNRKATERILNYSSFCFSAALRGLFLGKFDVVIATSPQLLVGVAGHMIARMRGAKFVFEVRDLWPESLIATGVSGESSLLYRSLLRVSKRLYRKSDHVVVVTPAFKQHIQAKFACAAEKISIVPNGVDLDWFTNARSTYVPERDGRFVVSFIGTVGNAHGVGTILQAAKLLGSNYPEVLFQIVGDGAERDKIANSIREQNLQNVQLIAQQPRSNVPALIWNSDVCLVLLRQSEVFKTVIPTKMLEFMACGRPIILGVEGQALEIMRTADAGIAIPPEDAEALASAVLTLKANPALSATYGQNGAAYIEKMMSRKRTAEDYEEVLKRVTGLTKKRPRDYATDAAGTR